MNIKQALRELDRRQKAVAAERDKLDEAIEEMEALRDSCARAHDALLSARDALSELV